MTATTATATATTTTIKLAKTKTATETGPTITAITTEDHRSIIQKEWTNQTRPNGTRDDYATDDGKLNGGIGFVLVLVCMIVLYTLVDCVCCVCYQKGVLWQKCGFICNRRPAQHVEVPTIIVTSYD